mmetsp:Transcript_2782/g.4058  ORF Transcript_2782/g.4058 Transcript_2782/m.4058 type:complete len:100 (+) Transcript_2782:82-381(+)
MRCINELRAAPSSGWRRAFVTGETKSELGRSRASAQLATKLLDFTSGLNGSCDGRRKTGQTSFVWTSQPQALCSAMQAAEPMGAVKAMGVRLCTLAVAA